jgi:large subunit ribosomal protein L15
MPLQMRLPKYGFSSRIGRVSAEVRTSELNKLEAKVITIEVLRKANLITAGIKRAKVMLSGDVTKAVTLEGIGVTKGARSAIEAAGGKVIDIEVPVKVKKLAKKAERPAVAAAKKPAKAKKNDVPAADE